MRLTFLPLVLLGLSACGTVRDHLPWHKPEPPAPAPVRELQVIVPAEDSQVPIVLQFRERNALVLDLTGVASRGTVELRPGESGQWPTRMALRFQPGRFEVIEVEGALRAVFPVTEDRAGPASIDVPPAAHAPGTPSLRLRWGPRDGF